MLRWLVIPLLLLLAPEAAHALRCGGRIVEVGDHAYELRKRCGEPYWIEEYSEWLVAGERGPFEQRVERRVEAWFYNFGPSKLLRRLTLRDNRIVREDSYGYGYARLGRACDFDALAPGASTGEIVARCGTPAAHDTRYATDTVRDHAGNARQRVIRREEWVYERDGRKPRLLTFVDGVLVNSERLDP